MRRPCTGRCLAGENCDHLYFKALRLRAGLCAVYGVDPDDIEMLEDLVAAAVNATVKQVDETAEAEMGKLTGGLNIPGL